MRVQLVILTLLVSFQAWSVEDKRINELFIKYNLIMQSHQTDLVEEVFTKKFLKDNGGKEEFIKEVKELPKTSQKSLLSPPRISWKKGIKDEIFFAKMTSPSSNKSQQVESGSEFIIKSEDGKLKIDGTLSDGE